MSTGPCEAAPIAWDCQFKKMVVVRPLVPKGLKFPGTIKLYIVNNKENKPLYTGLRRPF